MVVVLRLGLVAQAAGQPDTRAVPNGVALSYRAPPSCPGDDVFWGELAARATRPVERAAAGIAVSVDIEEDAGFVGHLTLGAVTQRVVRGRECREVVRALSLIAALALPDEVA